METESEGGRGQTLWEQNVGEGDFPAPKQKHSTGAFDCRLHREKLGICRRCKKLIEKEKR